MKWLVLIIAVSSFFLSCHKEESSPETYNIALQNDGKTSATLSLWKIEKINDSMFIRTDSIWGIADTGQTVKVGSLPEGTYRWNLYVKWGKIGNYNITGLDTTDDITIFMSKTCRVWCCGSHDWWTYCEW